MAKRRASRAGPGLRARMRGGARRALRWIARAVVALAATLVLWVAAYRWIDPPTTPYIMAEAARLDGVEREWVDIERVSPAFARAVVAAEDANFCRHWGFDMGAIRAAIEAGGERGASTISQQVVKNAFLWQGRSWPRKALEALITPVMEALWSKRRILEVYLNVAETGEGMFGVQAAARRAFGRDASEVTAMQGARIAATLPSPRTRDAARLGPALERRAGSIADGAATIRADGRAACFED